MSSLRKGCLFLTYLLKLSPNHTKVTCRIVAGPECVDNNKFGNIKKLLVTFIGECPEFIRIGSLL